MAKKMIFMPNELSILCEELIDFTYIKGMAFSQKQKNVLSLHQSIRLKYPRKKILEVSTKSNIDLGVQLSAFNLTLESKFVESVYQSSKVFNSDIQYQEISNMNPKDARHYLQGHKTGSLTGFKYNGQKFPLIPKSFFYDYLYIKALCEHQELANQLLDYDIFTDIEFNYKKQVNCQARACALYVYMCKKHKLDFYLSSPDNFKLLYKDTDQQLCLPIF